MLTRNVLYSLYSLRGFHIPNSLRLFFYFHYSLLCYIHAINTNTNLHLKDRRTVEKEDGRDVWRSSSPCSKAGPSASVRSGGSEPNVGLILM